MRAVIQRVDRATVTVGDRIVGEISEGLVALLGIGQEDDEADSRYLADKIINLRIFDDEQGLMNRSLLDIGGAMLVVSQFTLFGDCRKGRRPSYSNAAPPEKARLLYETFILLARSSAVTVATGEFQTMMRLSLTNNGPVTLLLDSRKSF